MLELLGQLLILGLQVYFYIIIAHVVISWLIVFEVINAKSQQAKNLINLLNRATEPVMEPIRRYVPPIGGLDLTPLIVILLLWVAESMIIQIFF